MTTPLQQSPVVLSDTQLSDLRTLMLGALLRRGFPRPDAEDAVQSVLARIHSHPQAFGPTLGAPQRHAGYFVKCALHAYRGRLREENRRRGRELAQAPRASVAGSAPLAGLDHRLVRDALELAAVVDLTARQRQYLRALFIDGRSIEDVATATGTTPRAVQAVLRRAAARMRAHLATTMASTTVASTTTPSTTTPATVMPSMPATTVASTTTPSTTMPSTTMPSTTMPSMPALGQAPCEPHVGDGQRGHGWPPAMR